MIPLPTYSGQSVAVFGFGKAGRATVSALLAAGAEVYVWDDRFAGGDKWREEEDDQNLLHHAALHIEPYDNWPWRELAGLLLSPGVPLTHPVPHPVVVEAQAKQCRITCDIALLLEAQPDARIVAVTGTNGKSTTTALIGHIIKYNKKPVQVGGNIGTPALALEGLEKDGIYILELSSYQLDLLEQPRFDVAVWLNISPDHLDRHGGIDGYVAAKRRIFSGQQKDDTAIISVDDKYSAAVAQALSQPVIPFSVTQELRDGVYVTDGTLHHPAEKFSCDLTGIPSLTGAHNWQNAAAAHAACWKLGVKPADIYAGMQQFAGLEHRMQCVAEIDGIRCINDSKATNAEAAQHALAAFDTIYWIAGGMAKDGGIESLKPFFPRIVHAFLIGQAQDQFAQTLEGTVAYSRCEELKQATQAALRMARAENKPGAVVLLSPACASFDQWKNFETRGEAFCELVHDLAGKDSRHVS